MSLFQDLRYALRLLAAPAFPPALAILSLALGIGATTAIFSVVYAVLIDPYPYTAADRIGGFHLFNAKNENHYVGYTLSEYLEIKAAAKSIESAISTDRRSVTLDRAGTPGSRQSRKVFLPMLSNSSASLPSSVAPSQPKGRRRRIESRSRRSSQLPLLATPFSRPTRHPWPIHPPQRQVLHDHRCPPGPLHLGRRRRLYSARHSPGQGRRATA